ncbi:MAG TPA: hypothetical protein VN709_03905 [Terriglobales bacterium]|nr:hypothetical protein [Terriglobales bacterium]
MVTVESSRGTETGSIIVDVLGTSYCKVTVDLSIPGEDRKWTTVVNGKRVQVSAAQELARALPHPNWAHGCALLPQSATIAAANPKASRAADASQVSLDPSTGLVQGVTWKDARGFVAIRYANYRGGDGLTYPGTVTESVAERRLMTIQFTSAGSKPSLTSADFALTLPPVPSTHGFGGGQ